MVASVTFEADVTDLWEKFVQDRDNQDYRNQLIEKYLPVVQYQAERTWARLPNEVEKDDLVSAGIFGLMDAIDSFDPSRGFKFETYCVPRICGAMLDELRSMDWVPRLVRSRARKLSEANKKLFDELGREPSDEELADHLGVTKGEMERLQSDANAINLVSLNKKWYETNGSKEVSEIDLIEDQRGEDPSRRIQKADIMRMVTKGLTRNERLIIILYYYEEMTMKEVGMTLNLSESRVSQMHSSIVSRLQQQLKERRPEFV